MEDGGKRRRRRSGNARGAAPFTLTEEAPVDKNAEVRAVSAFTLRFSE